MLVDADAAAVAGMMAFKASEFKMLVRPFVPWFLRSFRRIAIGDNFDKWASSFLAPSLPPPPLRQSVPPGLLHGASRKTLRYS